MRLNQQSGKPGQVLPITTFNVVPPRALAMCFGRGTFSVHFSSEGKVTLLSQRSFRISSSSTNSVTVYTLPSSSTVLAFIACQNQTNSIFGANANVGVHSFRSCIPKANLKMAFSLRSGKASLRARGAGTLLSSAGKRMRESWLKRTKRGSGLIRRVVESQLSEAVVPEDQQATFLWERQRMAPDRKQGTHSLQRRHQSRLRLIGKVVRPQLPKSTAPPTPNAAVLIQRESVIESA